MQILPAFIDPIKTNECVVPRALLRLVVVLVLVASTHVSSHDAKRDRVDSRGVELPIDALQGALLTHTWRGTEGGIGRHASHTHT